MSVLSFHTENRQAKGGVDTSQYQDYEVWRNPTISGRAFKCMFFSILCGSPLFGDQLTGSPGSPPARFFFGISL